jgi:hypothetical protein
MPLRQTRTRQALSRSARTRWAAGDSNCAWAKKKQEHPKILENFSKVCQLGFHLLSKFIRKIIGAPKRASAGERPVSSLGCAQRQRSTQMISLAQVAVAVRARSAALRWQLVKFS